ncbi:MAG: peptidase S41 [Betaproteobacteria bacterium]|nr:peptidase S41 [Betaproteobacteria bacterium]
MSKLREALRSRGPLIALLAGAAALLAACGGGGGGGGGGSTPPPSSTFGPSSQYAQQCDPTNPNAPAANKTGSLTIEKQWIRAYFDEAYLWYNQVPTVDPNAAAYSGSMASLSAFNVPVPLDNYFQALKTPQLTPTGAKVDKFSFTYSTADWNALSQSGVSAGYGMKIALLRASPPRSAVVAYTDPNTPATNASIARGAQILAIDGVDLVNGSDVTTLNRGLFPNANETHTFTIQDLGATTSRTVSLTAQVVTSTPVQNVKTITTPSGTVGYMLFTQHIASAEQPLINAINTLKAANVSDLVLDLRYNGGGYLYLASELAYMIAGPANTYVGANSKIFEKLTYNDKRTADTNNPNSTTPFFNTSCIPDANFKCTNTGALPYLGLNTVYVLVQGGTCSASESIINSLRGVGLTVRLIGGTTCGKPYGFTQKDNCGVSYFPIEFKGVNNQGYGDYTDGFTPSCTVSDDFNHALGDPAEAQLAGALAVRSTGLCPGGGTPMLKPQASLPAPAPQYTLLRNPLLENRWVLPGGGR